MDALCTAIETRQVNWIIDADIQNFFAAVSQTSSINRLEGERTPGPALTTRLSTARLSKSERLVRRGLENDGCDIVLISTSRYEDLSGPASLSRELGVAK